MMVRRFFTSCFAICGIAALAATSIACGSPSPIEGDPNDGTDAGDAGEEVDARDAAPPSVTGVLGEACSPSGALSCNGHAQKLQLLCSDGKWIANGVCPGQQVCDPRPGPTQGSCQDPPAYCAGKSPGEAVCEGVIRHVCGPELLDATSATCASDALCRAGTGEKCAKCLDGQRACAGEKLQKCASDHLSFVDEAACASAALCRATEGVCLTPSCGAGEYRCDYNDLVKCNADRTGLELVEKCGAGLCDAATKSCLACITGAKDCVGATPRTCDASGHWTSLAACTGATPVCTDGACGAGACSSGDYRCNGDKLEKCNATSTGFDSIKTCGAGLCNVTTKDCDECKTGESGCVASRPRSCVAGHWSLAAADCASPTPLCSGGTCVSLPETVVTFPSTTSKLKSGATLGAGGGAVFYKSGETVQQYFPRAIATTELDIDFTMSDGMTTTTCGGAALTFDVRVNGGLVGNFSFTPTGADHHIVKSYKFSPVPIIGPDTSITFVSTSAVCTGTPSWNWYAGGTAKMR